MKPKTVGRVAGPAASEPLSLISGLQANGVIMTLEGERQVSDLSPGDRIVTRDSGVATLKSVSSRVVTAPAIRIAAGSLGDTRPEIDVSLPSGQLVLVRDWRARAIFNTRQVLVAAHDLIDGEFVTDEGEAEMTLYHLHFDAPHILYVDGLELASAEVTQAGAEEKAA